MNVFSVKTTLVEGETRRPIRPGGNTKPASLRKHHSIYTTLLRSAVYPPELKSHGPVKLLQSVPLSRDDFIIVTRVCGRQQRVQGWTSFHMCSDFGAFVESSLLLWASKGDVLESFASALWNSGWLQMSAPCLKRSRMLLPQPYHPMAAKLPRCLFWRSFPHPLCTT